VAQDRARAAGAIAQLGNLGTTTGTPVLAAMLSGAMLHAVQARRRMQARRIEG